MNMARHVSHIHASIYQYAIPNEMSNDCAKFFSDIIERYSSYGSFADVSMVGLRVRRFVKRSA